MAEKRKVLKVTKDKEIPKSKKKVIQKQPVSDSSSSEDVRLPIKPKSKRGTTVYNYYYGPQAVQEKVLKRSKSEEQPVPLAPVILPPKPPPAPQVVHKKTSLTFV